MPRHRTPTMVSKPVSNMSTGPKLIDVEHHAREMERIHREKVKREAALRTANEAAKREKAKQEAAAKSIQESAEKERVAREASKREADAAAKRARLKHEADVNAARAKAARVKAQQEDIARLAREQAARAQAEHKATVRAADEAARKAAADHEAAMKAAAEEAIRIREEKEAVIKVAKEAADRARAEKEEAERKLKEGNQPEIWPTAEERESTKRRHQYTEGLFHIAIAGISGSGKSSLINALRGLRNNDQLAAATGVVETTSSITRYPDPNPECALVWYDVPGAGTLKITEWQYFNAQGLYVFDCIIVVFDNRFTATDIAILKSCARFNIPAYIVRSKSNQNIRNVALDMGYDSDEDDDDDLAILQGARSRYIEDTRQSVMRNLDGAKLPAQRVYIVCKDALQGVVQGKGTSQLIDEAELVQDLFKSHAK